MEDGSSRGTDWGKEMELLGVGSNQEKVIAIARIKIYCIHVSFSYNEIHYYV